MGNRLLFFFFFYFSIIVIPPFGQPHTVVGGFISIFRGQVDVLVKEANYHG